MPILSQDLDFYISICHYTFCVQWFEVSCLVDLGGIVDHVTVEIWWNCWSCDCWSWWNCWSCDCWNFLFIMLCIWGIFQIKVNVNHLMEGHHLLRQSSWMFDTRAQKKTKQTKKLVYHVKIMNRQPQTPIICNQICYWYWTEWLVD